jgi:pseudouridine kinase
MEKLTDREEQILRVLMNEPMLSQDELAERLDISRSAVAVHISNLIKKGYILGRGYVFNEEKKVVVVGGANFDLIGKGKGGLKYKTSNPGKVMKTVGGVGRNIAENLGKLKIPTTLLTAVGKDGLGDSILKRTKESGVDVSLVLKTDKYPSGTYIAILDENSDLALALADMDIVELVDRNYIKERLYTLKTANIIVCDTNVPTDTIEVMADYCKNTETLFVVEPVSVEKAQKVKNILSFIDIFTPNKEEMESLCGFPLNSLEDYKKAGNFALEKGIKILLLKLGPQGLYIHSEGYQKIFPSLASNIVDVTGAGDSLVAGFIASYFEGHSLEKCCQYALAVAAYTLEFNDTVAYDLSWAKIQTILGE